LLKALITQIETLLKRNQFIKVLWDLKVTDLRIGQIGHGLGPRAFRGLAQIFPKTTQRSLKICASGRKRDWGRLYESGYKKNEKEKKRYLIDVQFSTDKKLATTQDRQTLQNADEKQYCQYWILPLVVLS